MLDDIDELNKYIKNCEKCKLCKTRDKVVIGVGNINAKIMFIGEAPGQDENISGKIFESMSGKVIDNALAGLEINKEDIYFTNILKCAIPNNKVPDNECILSCLDYLRNEVVILKPKMVVLMGSIAIKSILGENLKVTEVHGKIIEKKGIMYLPTFHPASLLRNEKWKINFWKDLKEIKKFI